MVSLVQPLENGTMIEVGMIGNEGFVGVPVLLGAESSPLEAMVQIPGSALRMQASAFREEVTRRSTLLALLLRYVQALHIQVSLSAACNGRHTLPERLARWLLTARTTRAARGRCCTARRSITCWSRTCCSPMDRWPGSGRYPGKRWRTSARRPAWKPSAIAPSGMSTSVSCRSAGFCSFRLGFTPALRCFSAWAALDLFKLIGPKF